MRHPLPLQHEDFVLIGMVMRLKDSSRLKLNHPHGKVRRTLRLADDPADGLVLANGLLGNIAIISTQHITLQN
jgi:hypothetical protein